MSKCPYTTEEEKERLLEEYKRIKNSSKFKKITKNMPSIPKGRLKGIIMDSLDVVISGTYGADHAALNESHLKLLAERNLFVPIVTLKTPVKLNLAVDAGGESRFVTARQKSRISTTIETLEGSMRLRNVEYLVIPENMDEVLLSRPLLQSLRFNLDQQWLRIRLDFQNADCSSLTWETNLNLKNENNCNRGALSQLLQEKHSKEDANNHLNETESLLKSIGPEMDIGAHIQSDIDEHLASNLKDAEGEGLNKTCLHKSTRLCRNTKTFFD